MPTTDSVTENRLSLLLAEDDNNEVFLIRRAIKRLAMVECLMTVSDGESVIAYLEGGNRYADRRCYPMPDVLVLDQFMPRLSGLDVLVWIRTGHRFAHLPVAILSLGLSPAQTEQARLLKAACCAKTPQLESLPAAMEQAFELVQVETASARQRSGWADGVGRGHAGVFEPCHLSGGGFAAEPLLTSHEYNLDWTIGGLKGEDLK